MERDVSKNFCSHLFFKFFTLVVQNTRILQYTLLLVSSVYQRKEREKRRMVKTTSNKRALIRFLKVFSLPLVLLFLVFEMLESGKGGLHYSIHHHHRHGSSSGGSDNEMASGRGKVGVLRRQKKNNNVAFVRMREREEKLRKAMGIPEPIGEHKHERYDYRPASFSSSIPSYTKKVKGNARQDLLFNLKCDKEGREEKMHSSECRALGVGRHRSREQTEVEYVQESLEASEKGFGGPSGCKEAWITALGNDGFLPAVLVLLHTIRKYAVEDRDFIALVSTAVSEEVREKLTKESIRVIVVDPFENNEKAKALVSKSARYASGYWVVKMFVWKFEEYEKMVYVDADVYVRQNSDSMFCAETDPVKHSIAVTPRSSFDTKAGFNAGMFIYNPSNDVFDEIMEAFLALTETEMLATSEQDFLNVQFKNRYNLIPIDYVMKHRRMVKEKKLWDESRVHGYHMNGSPKPWEPQWMTQCAYPKDHQKFLKLYVDFFVEWWEYYYDMLDETPPDDKKEYKLLPEHDPANSFGKFASEYKCPLNPKKKSL
jgi:inositol 3-alpha-galactosyltransferase